MIASLTGTLIERGLSEVIIDVGGVGYRVHMPALSLASLPPVGEVTAIRTYLQVTDSAMTLFGFTDSSEEAIFKQLIQVSGIGPKMALAALSTFTPTQIIEAIVSQDSSFISKIPGVGKKTASRIVLELKDLYPEGMVSSSQKEQIPGRSPDALKDIQDALLSLGFTSQEIDLALGDAPADLPEGELLTYALKRLGSA